MGTCFCTGQCRVAPYTCPAGDFSRTNNPDYDNKIAQRAVMEYILSQQKAKGPKGTSRCK